MNYELHQGDCLEVMKMIPDSSVDMILCDLPYGTTACAWDTVIPFDQLWEQYSRIAKDTAPIVLMAAQPFTTALISSNMSLYRYCWIWLKERGTGFPISKLQPLRMTEDVVVFYKKQPKYKYQGEKLSKPYSHVLPITKSDSSRVSGTGYDEDGNRIRAYYTHSTKNNLISIPRDNNKNNNHPTQKPVRLMEFLIETYTDELDTILDNCMGSGTTGVACANLNRNFIGIEMNQKYFDIAKTRITDARETVENIAEFESNLFE